MVRHAIAHGIGLVGQVGLQVFPDDTVQRGGLGAAPAIGLGMGGGGWPGRWCGPPGLSVSGAGLGGHRQPLASRGARSRVSTSRTANGWGGGMEKGAGGCVLLAQGKSRILWNEVGRMRPFIPSAYKEVGAKSVLDSTRMKSKRSRTPKGEAQLEAFLARPSHPEGKSVHGSSQGSNGRNTITA